MIENKNKEYLHIAIVLCYMTPRRYSLSNLKKALDDPSLFVEEGKRVNKEILHSVNKRLNQYFYREKYEDQFDVMAADWDNLIILDGFRYDYFEEYSDIDGELSRIVSQGSHSTEFQEKTFSDKQFHDTIYITSNPHSPELISNDTFFLMESVYSEDIDGAAREHYPERVVEMAIPVTEEYPDKRHIIHLMQPNVPFIGDTAKEIRGRLYDQEGVVFRGMEPSDMSGDFTPNDILGELKVACKKGYITEEELAQAYTENVHIALEYADKLVDELKGKTVITADHGEMLGESVPPLRFKQFSHEPYLYTDELRHVPWLVIESEDRRRIVAEDPIDDDELSDDVVKDRLKQLGYVDYAN